MTPIPPLTVNAPVVLDVDTLPFPTRTLPVTESYFKFAAPAMLPFRLYCTCELVPAALPVI